MRASILSWLGSALLSTMAAPGCGQGSSSVAPGEDEAEDAAESSGSSDAVGSDTTTSGESTDTAATDGSDSTDASTDTGAALEVEILSLDYGPDGDQTLDLHLPAPKPGEAMTTIVLAHGGLWQGGDKSQLAPLCDAIVRSGGALACATINYRLSQDLGGQCSGVGGDTYREQVADLAAAFGLLREQADTHGLDPAEIFLGGHSAGGHLAQTLNLRAPEFIDDCAGRCPGPAGAVGFEGIYDIAAWDAYDQDFWGGQFSCATRKAFGTPPDDPAPCLDPVYGEACWSIGSPTYLAQQSAALALAPAGPVLAIHSPGDDWVDIAEAQSFAAAMSAAFPGLSVGLSVDGSCASGGHNELLLDPALAACIVDFVTGEGR